MEESNFKKFWNLSSICYFHKYFLRTHLNIYKIYWFYWLDLWINYKILPLFASFEQKIKIEKMCQSWDFPNCFIVNKIKENVAQVSLAKSCVTWWLRHLDAYLNSWVQIYVTHVHEFKYLVVYMMHILMYVYVCIYAVRRAYRWVLIDLPFIT
jgi:hypothetical protein